MTTYYAKEPMIRWLPPAVAAQEIVYPDFLTDFKTKLMLSFYQQETPGGVQAHYPIGGYDEVASEYLGEWDQLFADQVRAWWSHAASGHLFDFWGEADQTDVGTVVTCTPGETWMDVYCVSVGTPFKTPREYVVHPSTALYDIAKRDAFLSTSADENPPGSDIWRLHFSNPLTFAHAAGEQVRSRYGYPNSAVLQSEYPLVEEPGHLMRMSLRFRSQAQIVTP